jgi:hypothetical protein
LVIILKLDIFLHLPMKKLFIPTLLVASLFLFSGCLPKKTPPTPPPAAPTPTPPETQLPSEERPIITITPNEDVTEATLTITNLPESVKTVSYELVYTSAGLERGVIGTYTVSKGEATLLLGSCSSGVCKYDKDITGGTLTIRYRVDGQKILLREPFVVPSPSE